MVKLLGFVCLILAISSGTWWLFVLAFLLWQFGGSGNLVKAMWVVDKLHRRDDE